MKPIIFGVSASDTPIVHEQHLAGPDMNDEAAVNAWFCAWLANEDPIPDATAATFRGVGDKSFLNRMREENIRLRFEFRKVACDNYEPLKGPDETTK